jgi:mRNA-degrading endonuclease toxin of MazEF toxin-antitoxin module
MTRGDVWWVDFNPATGSEIQKTRPAVIVSDTVINAVIERVTNTGYRPVPVVWVFCLRRGV